MSKVVYCDCCQKACSGNYFELSGWWHLVEEHSKSRVGERLSETISGDVCSQCRDQVGLQTNLEPTRQERRRRWVAANPEKPRLQALRKTACVYVEDVFCDRCQQVCSEQYARLSSSWLTANQETLYRAHLRSFEL